MIYLDHNATTPLHPRALEAMLPYLKENWGNPSSAHRFGIVAKTAIEKARSQMAECLGCKPAEIIFCSSGTESDNLALRGVARALHHKGNHIITTAIEHHAVLETCRALEQEGFRITYLPVDTNGAVDLEELKACLDKNTILLSVMHANNETGVLQPIEEMVKLAKRYRVLFHTDAVQTVGKLPKRLGELGANLLTLSAHKLYGPKGIAALVVKTGTALAPMTTGGHHEHGLRAGTENVSGIVGFAEALKLACDDLETEARRLLTLRDGFEASLRQKIPNVTIHGAQALRVPNTSNLSFESIDGESIALAMDLRGICVSTGSACTTGDPEPSHVLLAMGCKAREAQGSIRISMGRDTKEQDLKETISALQDCVKRLQSISNLHGAQESKTHPQHSLRTRGHE